MGFGPEYNNRSSFAARLEKQMDNHHARLTPEVLREAADGLTSDDIYPGEYFTCHAVENLVGWVGREEYFRLLERHDALDGNVLNGNVLNWLDCPEPLTVKERQSVRFMFLEFLALDMETSE